MNSFFRKASLVVVLFLFLAGTTLFLAAEEKPFLPGLIQEDDHPNGCTDCHRLAGEGRDYRLNVSLKEMEDHPDITMIVNTLPQDCAMCHQKGSDAGELSMVLHKAHYHDPKVENHFIEYYQGECLNCHFLDLKTGDMKIKGGAKNW